MFEALSLSLLSGLLFAAQSFDPFLFVPDLSFLQAASERSFTGNDQCNGNLPYSRFQPASRFVLPGATVAT
ncbi:hypothetical protein ATB93_03015 [Sphingomonas sp. WG]|nr:hypothetical protein ATB93_03015 [Sphingomonas sp. WG]